MLGLHAAGKILVGCGAWSARGGEDSSGVRSRVCARAVGKILVGCGAWSARARWGRF